MESSRKRLPLIQSSGGGPLEVDIFRSAIVDYTPRPSLSLGCSAGELRHENLVIRSPVNCVTQPGREICNEFATPMHVSTEFIANFHQSSVAILC
jgi:hypothetical protein